ncbi:DUF6042 family protein [Streptomyces sp. P9(2023)]|uniref:DUF6042 family protein n=1 Tax=Streptomyces sp. P9(2023) TaxID=3064394 RepID=UPI0028F422B6|nr:DUF6042 family protein [Streptomyces sp. P9(2023)]MDT9692788.1 DUF6042 family protein [Streptomyces sp. P9(2023)]
MSVDQDTPQDSDSYLSMHNDWFPSGWSSYLPQHQSMVVCMIFGTATVRDLRGSIDDVVHQLFDGRPSGFFGRDGDTLDSPLAWMDPDELNYAETDEEKAQLLADAEAHQAKCEGLLHDAGLAVPTTIRELADTMLALGIATQKNGAWSMPENIPRPENVLPLADEERARIADTRRVWESAPSEQALIKYLKDELERPDEVFTSIDRLAEAADLRHDDVRYTLGRMFREGELRLERGEAREQVLLEDLKNHQRFHLVLDWAHFEENRITIVRG